MNRTGHRRSTYGTSIVCYILFGRFAKRRVFTLRHYVLRDVPDDVPGNGGRVDHRPTVNERTGNGVVLYTRAREFIARISRTYRVRTTRSRFRGRVSFVPRSQ